MRLRDKFRELKINYADCIVIIKSGMFFVTFDDDARILKTIFNYQINDGKVGFPVSSLEKVVQGLKNKAISCITYVDGESECYLVEDNKYGRYVIEAKKEEFHSSINKALLDRISFLLESNKYNYNIIKEFIVELS